MARPYGNPLQTNFLLLSLHYLYFQSCRMNFLKEFIMNPKSTGAVAPSSKRLVELMVSTAELSDKKLVVELGPGTGVFTKEIVETLSPDADFFCIESNEKFAKELKVILPDCNIYT